MELFIVRHGESVGNISVEDMPDAELTALGKEQAVQVSEVLQQFGIEHIIASPLVRAISTALPLAQKLQLTIEVWKNTYEVRRLGQYIGPKLLHLQERFPEVIFPEDLEQDGWIYPGDETEQMARERADNVFATLYQRFAGQRVALFAHGGLNHYLISTCLGVSENGVGSFHQHNSGICWIKAEQAGILVKYFGEHMYLYPSKEQSHPLFD